MNNGLKAILLIILAPVLLDTSRDVALKYNVRAMPTTWLIDKDGMKP